MQTIRSFVAIPVPTPVQRKAAQLVERLQFEGDGIKWVPVDNLHLTLKFLGDVDNRDVPAVCAAVEQCCEGIEPFTLQFRGVGGFPDIARPRVIWAGVIQGGESLCTLAARLETRLAEHGFKPEARDYRPHLTLGRTRGGSKRGSPDLEARLQRQAQTDLGSFLVEEVCVVASFLDKTGPTYNVMDRITLESEE